MKKSYNIYEVVKTLFVEVNKDSVADKIRFDFMIAILMINNEEYYVQVYRAETLEVKTISGDYSHDEMLVRDFFLADDLLRFTSEAEATDFITRRLDELFG